MNILVLQETDWLTRGPHIQHHLSERLSTNPSFKITVIDYDIDNLRRSQSIIQKKIKFYNINRTIKNSNVKIIRTAHLNIPYLRRLSSLITNFFEMVEVIRKNRPDIIIGYSISNGLIGLLLAKLFRIPYIFHYIDILHELVPIINAQDIARITSRFLLKYSDLVLVFTKYQFNIIENEGASPETIQILSNGISLENTIVNKSEFLKLKSKFSILDDDFVIFYMGWLYKFAGLKEIIDFYNQDVKDGKYKLKFLILGDGDIYHDLLKHIKEIGANWVILAGKVPYFAVTEFIELADLCLLSFKINKITREITPIKIMEYMAMKKPVLSNKLPGVYLQIGENNGVIFAKNQKELIKKIGELQKHKEDLVQIGQKGFEFVKTNYSFQKILKDFCKIIRDVLRKK